jgi:phosphopantothenoylcysteine synthetase/decarboxylase
VAISSVSYAMLSPPWSATVFVATAAVADWRPAQAADQSFKGEVVRVGTEDKQIVLNVPDGQSAEGKLVTIRVDRATQIQGADSLSQIQQGQSLQVVAKKSWFSQQLVAERLIYAPTVKNQMMLSRVENAQMNQIESQFAQGQMGDVEYETNRQLLEK